MDPRGARTLKDLFRALAQDGVTIFLSTHSIDTAEEICHRIGIIGQGKLIACGTMTPAKTKAMTAPFGPPNICPIQTTSAVNAARRIVVRKRFIFPPFSYPSS